MAVTGGFGIAVRMMYDPCAGRLLFVLPSYNCGPVLDLLMDVCEACYAYERLAFGCGFVGCSVSVGCGVVWFGVWWISCVVWVGLDFGW